MLPLLNQMHPPLLSVVQGIRTRHHNPTSRRCVLPSIWENPGFRGDLGQEFWSLSDGTTQLVLLQLTSRARERAVPSSRISRMVNFGGAFLSLPTPFSFHLVSCLLSSLPPSPPFHVPSPPIYTALHHPSPPPPLPPPTHTHVKALLPVWVLEQLLRLLNEPWASLTINLPSGKTLCSLRPTLNGL